MMLKPVRIESVFFIYPVLSGFIRSNLFFSVFFVKHLFITFLFCYICACQTQKTSKKWKQKTRKRLKINYLHC